MIAGVDIERPGTRMSIGDARKGLRSHHCCPTSTCAGLSWVGKCWDTSGVLMPRSSTMPMIVRQAMCARDEGLLVPRSRLAEAGCKPP